VATSITTTLSLTTNANFLSVNGGTISGTPSQAGTYYVKVTAAASDGRTITQEYTLTVTAAPAPTVPDNTPEPDDAATPDNSSSDSPSNQTTSPVDDGTQNTTATNNTSAGNNSTSNTSSDTNPRTVTSWRSNWLKSLFGWFNWPIFGGSSSLAKPVSMESTSSFSGSAYVLGGPSGDSSLAMISMAATAALAGAYLWVSRKMN
jgi:hypothetical protein